MRLVSVLPTMIILATNMAGFIINVIKPSNFKSMLKTILALNIIRESVEVCFNIFMIIFRNEFTMIPKEVYFGRFFSNIWWLSLCVSFSKSRWVSNKSKARGGGKASINLNRSGGSNSNMESYGYDDGGRSGRGDSTGFNMYRDNLRYNFGDDNDIY